MSATTPPDEGRAAADHRTAAAFRQEAPRLRAWLRRHATAWQGIDDLLQDLFLELVLANRAARQIENVGAWLFQVARHRIIDGLRQRQPLNHAVSLDGTPGVSSSTTFAPAIRSELSDPEAQYRRADFVRQVTQALQELPAEQRKTFVAHELDGLSFAQIAAREGIGINTALARKRYAVLHLRARLAASYNDSFTEL